MNSEDSRKPAEGGATPRLAEPGERTQTPLCAGAPRPGAVTVHPLTDERREEVLSFLSARPIHTVIMAGFIRDNGLESPLNRGTFYACSDRDGRLEGVALIGHATLVEARSEAALAAFARLTRGSPRARMILGEREKVERFWAHFAEPGRAPRRCSELLLVQRVPSAGRDAVEGLRRATLDDLERVMPVQARMYSEESGGDDPLERDADGFRRRYARRIEQGRVWVLVEDGRLIFKADVISDTPEVVYLEGIYVTPEERGKSYGLNCLSQLSRGLLERTRSVCLFIGAQKHKAQAFYSKAGYSLYSYYDAIFLRPGDG